MDGSWILYVTQALEVLGAGIVLRDPRIVAAQTAALSIFSRRCGLLGCGLLGCVYQHVLQPH